MHDGAEDDSAAAFDPQESDVAPGLGEAGTGRVMVGLGCGEAAKTAAGSTVAQMSGGLGEAGDGIGLPAGGWLRQAVVERAFEFADGLFDRAVVARIISGAVQGDDGVFGQQLIHCVMIEDAAVIALEQERKAMTREESAQVPGDLLTVRFKTHQRREGKTGGKVDGVDQQEAAAAAVPAVFGGINGPGQIGLAPVDAAQARALDPVGRDLMCTMRSLRISFSNRLVPRQVAYCGPLSVSISFGG
jgi:hypothetical protein